MAKEEVVMEIKAEINPAKKQVEEFTKTLDDAEKAQKELNEQISIQNKVLNDLEKELVELKAVQDSIPKGAFYAGMSDLNAKIKETEKNIKLEKLGLKDLQNQQKDNNNEIKEQTKALKETNNAAEETIGNFKIMGVSLNGIKSTFGKIIPLAKTMFGTIRAGLISTGIGALLVAFGSLVTFFTKTQRGADKVKVALAGVSAAFNVIRDRISTVGEAISLVFSGKFSEAADKLKDSFKGIGDEIKEEIKVMTDLEKRQQALRDAEIQFTVQRAKTRKEIEKARLLAEDETKSQEERIEALQKALDLETQTTQRELELARERVRIQEEQMAISENLVEDEKKLADFRADVLAKETKSLRLQKRVKTEINELNREIEAEEEAARKKKEQEEEAARKKKEAADKKAAKEAEKLAKKQAKELLDIAKATEDAKKDLIEQGFAVAGELAGENAQLSKGVAVAQTVYSTQQAIMAALAATSVGDKLLPYPLRLANAIGAGIMGASAIKKILSTGTDGSGASPSVPTSPTAGTPAPQMLSGRFELGGDQEQQPVQAYVVTDDLTDNQNKLAYIRRRATI
jgi:chromosome segregation ATPase|tara:strand:+ start:1437 stop:3152 length:1716 start_codon:yes stop_codon:yes gene_type:complete